MIALERLNNDSARDFVAALGTTFEHSPWVAERVVALRPFKSILALHEALCEAVMQAEKTLQLALIRAHPELAGRAALRGELTSASTGEQRGAGLSALTRPQLARLQSLNAQYTERFGFPFILAVRGHTPDSVIAALAERLNHDADEERRVALRQICRIAFFRLTDLVQEPLGDAVIATAEGVVPRGHVQARPDGPGALNRDAPADRSSTSPSRRAFLGDALHTPKPGEVEFLANVLIEVDGGGAIRSMHRTESPQTSRMAAHHLAQGTLVTLEKGQLLLPGFVDLHVHAPQWPQLGLALDLPLEEWLQACTFPLEARYADTAYARVVYESLVDALLANGTTTAMYFGTIHLAATQVLAEICLKRYQRALIGRVAMDDPEQCPAYYRDSSAVIAESETRGFIGHVRSMAGNESGLILPVITPRFIPSCSHELLERLGRLARETGCHVQTHCSESDWEHAFVLGRYGVTDTAALDRLGLLSRHTILAHGNFIDGPDIAAILAAGAGIAHCPLSNVYFSDAVFPLRRLLERGVHIGLGTDIAGGASPSILENARHAVIASRSLESGVDPRLARNARRSPDSRIDAATAFWLATAGGGIALDLPIGLFREGYQFDAVILDARTPDSNLRLRESAAPEEILQKVVYHATRADIQEVWVANRRVHTRSGAREER